MIRRRSGSTPAQSSSSIDVQSLVLSNELEKGKEAAVLVSREPLETINALLRFPIMEAAALYLFRRT